MVEISVVVPSLKPPEELEVTTYLNDQTFHDYEIIVRDEAPVTKARNEGIRRAEADKIVFLDDDSRPNREYLARAATVLEQEAAFAGRTIHPRDDVFARHFTNHYDWGNEPCYVRRFWGCNMGIHRDVFETVGGWDEGMGWGHEEKELADRVAAEFDIRYDPELVVEHPYVESVRDYWHKHYRLETQSPYYWTKRGMSIKQQFKRTAMDFVSPLRYVRCTPAGTIVQAGSTLAKTAGRIRGFLDSRHTDGRDADSVPAFEKTDEAADVIKQTAD
jgi:glycosyltransferase involved in cell wall biosynthesis